MNVSKGKREGTEMGGCECECKCECSFFLSWGGRREDPAAKREQQLGLVQAQQQSHEIRPLFWLQIEQLKSREIRHVIPMSPLERIQTNAADEYTGAVDSQ